jgi:TetR/AcrR family transcriptional repressor of nem operon
MFIFIYQMVGIMNESKEHILLTSLTLFLQKSFKEVTMKEIVDKTGMSKGAFYHYFSSKEQVFSEVIQHFFVSMMTADYTRLTHRSLKEFYKEILDLFEKNRKKLKKMIPEDEHGPINNNYYYLIFDAMKMLPDFKERHRQEQKEELKAWKNVISIAKKHKEIKTHMNDEQVAKLFINVGDGTYINLIMSDNVNKKNNELEELWDGLYDALKA